MGLTNTPAGKILTIKVRGRRSLRNADHETVGFHGVTPQSTRRRKVGEVFEILSTPYRKTQFHMKRNDDDFKKMKMDGDAREAMIAHFGWEGDQAAAYLLYQFFDPETMELVEPLSGNEEEVSEILPNNHLIALTEQAAVKVVRKTDDKPTLEAWEAVEKAQPQPRKKVLDAIKEGLDV